MKDIPNANDLVLIGIMPKPQDLEIARVLGWYRIPVRSALRIFILDYLAFYQPASFGDQKWQIKHYAKYAGHELVMRSDLFKDETKHPYANREYLKMQLGPLQTLPTPIRAESWKRITFIYTSGERLMNASTLSDLKINDPDEKKMFTHLLKERARESEQYYTPDPDVEKREKQILWEYIAQLGLSLDEGDEDELA